MVERLAALEPAHAGLVLPLFATVVAVALAGGVLAGGWNFTLEPLQPKFGKLNPLAGLGRVFAGPQLVDTLKACLLATVLGGVAALLPEPAVDAARRSCWPCRCRRRWPKAAGCCWAACCCWWRAGRLRAGRRAAAAPAAPAPAAHEHRGSEEGDQGGRGQRRGQGQDEAAHARDGQPPHAGRGAARRPGGDEPDPLRGGAEVRRGRRWPRRAWWPRAPTCWRCASATWHATPRCRCCRRRRWRARCTRTAEVDQEIPARLFGAVAQVLAWVYQLRDAMAAGRPLPGAAPRPEVPADMDPLRQPRRTRRRPRRGLTHERARRPADRAARPAGRRPRRRHEDAAAARLRRHDAGDDGAAAAGASCSTCCSPSTSRWR